ncbi:hypothetical protein KPH14_006397 [Odynerus spinipes]|uniref:Alpha-carbonic anhydrase domain-containing protein n=1 Tax=Odynerus spinipes TaxID=1348599 RepID=A0AAD9RZH8_9HYME|nr:hypothetical protein KPH14_006397 [Odynerus spinipes]
MALLPEYYKGVIGLAKSGQSPIDLDDEIARPKRYPPLILNGHWLNEGEAVLGNDGKVATVVLGGHRVPSTVSGGPLLNDIYEFFICNFRWGKENCNGSEHTINGTWFSMEAQMVHWNRKYPTFDDCLKHKDGLCILSFLFLVPRRSCPDNNPQFYKITENLKYVVNAGSEVNIPPNALCWMRWATRCERYYSYQGSYNEGPRDIFGYPECVTWIIFPLVIPISPCHVEAFRMLKDEEGEPIKNNCAKIQLLRGRRIFVCIS